MGWGGETALAAFKPLLSPPKVDVEQEPDDLDLTGLGLDPAVEEEIQKRPRAKCRANRDHFKVALETSNKNFSSMYHRFARCVNFTSDSAVSYTHLTLPTICSV